MAFRSEDVLHILLAVATGVPRVHPVVVDNI